jgi:hypothetical protein
VVKKEGRKFGKTDRGPVLTGVMYNHVILSSNKRTYLTSFYKGYNSKRAFAHAITTTSAKIILSSFKL